MMREVEAFADAGGPVLGICNGFQVLCEAASPGVLRLNHHGRFVCRDVDLVVERSFALVRRPGVGAVLRIPVKHHEGAWYAPPRLTRRGRRSGGAPLCRQPNGALADMPA
jgi:phosphoribosylformylglycinamidine synthase